MSNNTLLDPGYFLVVKKTSLPMTESGISYKFLREPDDTGFTRFKTLTVEFEEGKMPLLLITFNYEWQDSYNEIISGYLDPLLTLEKTSWPDTFYVKCKEPKLKDTIYRIAFNRMDTIKYPFCKCIHPSRIMISNEKDAEQWL